MFGRKNGDTLFRAVKFEICPTDAQLVVLLQISNICRRVWNEALGERNEIFDAHIRSIYEKLKQAEESGADKKTLVELRQKLKQAYKDHPLPTYLEQQNALTDRIPKDPELQLILRAWIEQVLVELHGSINSFMKLRKKGDLDAKPPRIKDEGFFCDISGRFGFKVNPEDGTVRLSTERIAGENFVFPIPSYQLVQLRSGTKVKDFTIYRDPLDLSKPRRLWISLAYEIPKPEEKAFDPEQAVYIALGASAIGLVWPGGSQVIKLARPDKYWKPRIEQVQARMEGLKKGSKKWSRQNAARQKMFGLMRRQQTQARRELVQRLLTLGDHFVVSEMVVRSKPGKLADSRKPERGGSLGPNWAAQSTGTIALLVQWLQIKVQEQGGSVRRFKPDTRPSNLPPDLSERKLMLARHLREEFVHSQDVSASR